MPDNAKFSVPPTLGSLQPSLTLGITSQAKAMIAAGEDVAGLCAGEPDFDTPEHIKTAAIDALMAGDTKYTPVAGRADLRAAIATKLAKDNDIPCAAEQVVLAPGAKFSVFSTIAALCGPGDEVLIPSPYWLSYPAMVQAVGATPVGVQTCAAEGFSLTPEILEKHITAATKLLILNSPCNPTGSLYTQETLEGIAALAQKHGFMILADEIYEKLVFDQQVHVSIASLSRDVAAQTITINGFSKAYSMTGWRLGYLAGPTWLVKRISALQSHTTSNPTSFAQAGALAALQGPQEPVEIMRQEFARRRDLIYSLLSAIPGITVNKPKGTFYIFPDISSLGLDSMTFAQRLLKEKKVAVIPGQPFAADNHIRLSYACSQKTIETACSRLKDFCAAL